MLPSRKIDQLYCQSRWNRAGLLAVYRTVCWDGRAGGSFYDNATWSSRPPGHVALKRRWALERVSAPS
jgi:hypothetical protein